MVHRILRFLSAVVVAASMAATGALADMAMESHGTLPAGVAHGSMPCGDHGDHSATVTTPDASP